MAQQPISKFFAGLGFPLRNIRWSWGGRNGDALLLRGWTDEYAARDRRLTVLREPTALQLMDSFGLDERIVQLKALWSGDVAGYAVIAEVRDKDSRPREIKTYRDDAVFAIKQLEARDDGSIAAVIGDLVRIGALHAHARTHRTAAGDGPFPVDDSQRSGLSTDSYQQKLPAIRTWLVETSRARGTVTYADMMNRFGLTFYPLRNAMSRLGRDCKSAGEPIITAIIVDKETGRCSEGLFDEFHIDDELERQRCYAHWASDERDERDAPDGDTPDEASADANFEQRAARFAQVEVRPQQGAFRQAVFRTCKGRCVISGCMVPEALEAAHLTGRDWRKGHNRASDGILLRRDLHTLYDRGLLRIGEDGRVELDESAMSHYADLSGVRVADE